MVPPVWNETYTKKGNEKFTFQKCDELVGDEIFFNPYIQQSYISIYFLGRWRLQNKQTEVIFLDGSVLLSVKIGGRLYPTLFQLTHDFSPLTLGYEFFMTHSWTLDENGIDTPYGRLYINPENNSLDTSLADKIFTVETESAKKKEKGWTRESQIQKLHKYFGHCHADSLWRIIRQSSNKEEFTHTEIENLCEECQTCQLSKRKSSRKKTSLPRSS